MNQKMSNKKFVLGQYFTRPEIVERTINLILNYKDYERKIRILEPSFGTGNFIQILKEKGFINIKGCEIDKRFTKRPIDFFQYPLEKKFNLIIGNPPFTKYNVKKSYYYPRKYFFSGIRPEKYLTNRQTEKEKLRIENAFILKSIKHLKDDDSSIGFVLPISFFIANKNKQTKKEILKKFRTIIIYQNDKKWVDEPIPCCFAIFTNTEPSKDKIVLLYEDGKKVEEVLDKSDLLAKELIPKSFLYKKNNNMEGIPLSKFLSKKRVKYNRSYKENNVSGGNILEKKFISRKEKISDYYLAVCRVGNSSVGRTGLINIKKDILNDMLYVFKFKEEFNRNKKLKEKICRLINKGQDHFKNSSVRVGSKSIKKRDILEFKI